MCGGNGGIRVRGGDVDHASDDAGCGRLSLAAAAAAATDIMATRVDPEDRFYLLNSKTRHKTTFVLCI